MFPKQRLKSAVSHLATYLRGQFTHSATPHDRNATERSIEARPEQPSAAQPAKRATNDDEHSEILSTFEASARLGYVPADALIGRLYRYHCERLAEDQRKLVSLEHELDAHLRRLDARFPAPAPLPPEKPKPPRSRHFRPLNHVWTTPGAQIRH